MEAKCQHPQVGLTFLFHVFRSLLCSSSSENVAQEKVVLFGTAVMWLRRKWFLFGTAAIWHSPYDNSKRMVLLYCNIIRSGIAIINNGGSFYFFQVCFREGKADVGCGYSVDETDWRLTFFLCIFYYLGLLSISNL